VKNAFYDHPSRKYLYYRFSEKCFATPLPESEARGLMATRVFAGTLRARRGAARPRGDATTASLSKDVVEGNAHLRNDVSRASDVSGHPKTLPRRGFFRAFSRRASGETVLLRRGERARARLAALRRFAVRAYHVARGGVLVLPRGHEHGVVRRTAFTRPQRNTASRERPPAGRLSSRRTATRETREPASSVARDRREARRFGRFEVRRRGSASRFGVEVRFERRAGDDHRESVFFTSTTTDHTTPWFRATRDRYARILND
jgi:hypothetical protein